MFVRMTWINIQAAKSGVSFLHSAGAPTLLEREMEMDSNTRFSLFNSAAITLAKAGTMVGAMAGSAYAQSGDIPGRNMPYYHGPGMMWGGGQWGGFGMVLGPVFMILLLVGIVLGVLYLLRHFGGGGIGLGPTQADGRALAILKERYAKGEIDSAEFEERRTKLAE